MQISSSSLQCPRATIEGYSHAVRGPASGTWESLDLYFLGSERSPNFAD